jgi:hypothetical protein
MSSTIVLAKNTIKDTRIQYRILGFRLIIGCLEKPLRVVFIAFYGLEFWLLSLQALGLFEYFRRFLEIIKAAPWVRRAQGLRALLEGVKASFKWSKSPFGGLLGP